MNSLPVLAIMGPTASGKTALALALAESMPIEIISVDSALIYRGMDIGTAKPTADELSRVPHHLIDILDPTESYSAADFVIDCKRLVTEIQQRGCMPVLVGGTMMYFHALQQGMADLPSANPELRESLQAWYNNAPEQMHQHLAQIDPQAAQRIHANDPQRLIRALEVFELTGIPLTQHQQAQKPSSWEVNLVKVGLIPQDRARLHQQIEVRLHQMFAQGFLQEVAQLYQRGDLHEDLPSIRCVGYRQAWDYMKGELNETQCFEKALVATRQLAKRQLTWLRKEQDMLILDPFQMDLAQKVQRIRQVVA